MFRFIFSVLILMPLTAMTQPEEPGEGVPGEDTPISVTVDEDFKLPGDDLKVPGEDFKLPPPGVGDKPPTDPGLIDDGKVEPLELPRLRTCKDLGLNPNPPGAGPILQRYYRSTDGVGGHGCWVHPHRNRKDFVVTPWSWGSEPTPGKQYLIDTVKQTMSDARSALAPLGGLNVGIYYLLNDVHDNAETYWLTQNQCWIEAGPHGGGGSWRGATPHMLPGQIAHEIGHCFLMVNIPGYSLETREQYLDQWWDESGANYYSSVVYPDLNYEHGDAQAFDLDGAPFEQAYSAYALLQSYSVSHGAEAILPLLIGIFELRERDLRLGHLQAEGFDADFHNFVFDHYRQGVSDSPGAGMLPSEAPDGVGFLVDESLFEDAGAVPIEPIPEARLSIVHIEAPSGFHISLTPPEAPGLRASLIATGLIERNFTATLNFSGSCEEPFEASVLLSHLDRRPIKDLVLPYTLEAMDREECGPPPRCEVGLWEETTELVRDSRTLDQATVDILKEKAHIDVRLLPESFGYNDPERVYLPQGATILRYYGFAGPRLLIERGGQWQINDPHRFSMNAPGGRQNRDVIFSGETGHWVGDDGVLLRVEFDQTTEVFAFHAEGLGDDYRVVDEANPPRRPRAYAVECADDGLILNGTGERAFADPRFFKRVSP